MTRYVLAVDPGDRHVGVAVWSAGDDCVHCSEMSAADAMPAIRNALRCAIADGRDPVLVVEDFQLYADRAAVQIGSAMETSQMIGQLKMVAGDLGIRYEGQGALIKTGMRAQCKARGIHLSGSIHARDAGLHAVYHVLFNGLGLR